MLKSTCFLWSIHLPPIETHLLPNSTLRRQHFQSVYLYWPQLCDIVIYIQPRYALSGRISRLSAIKEGLNATEKQLSQI